MAARMKPLSRSADAKVGPEDMLEKMCYEAIFDMTNIGLHIKSTRSVWGINTKEAAAQIGINPGHLNGIETGRVIPSYKLIERIRDWAHALKERAANAKQTSQGEADPSGLQAETSSASVA
jgi:transcriptional regulator with XRE-family HTH domain